MQTLVSLPYLRIYLHHEAAVPSLELQWLGFATSNEFRQAVEQGLQLARQHRVQGWVADDRLLGAVRPRDLDWVNRELLQSLETLGLQRFALLESQDALNRLTIAGMYGQAQPNLSYEVRRFDDLSRARAWAGGA